MDPLSETAQARLIDVTRLVSRAGRVPTGIDRVELAWLRHLLGQPEAVMGLLRTPFGWVLAGRDGLVRFERAMAAGMSGRGDLLSRLSRRPAAVQAAETLLRRGAVARSLHGGLAAMLRRQLPGRVTACNVGHANLTEETLGALRSVPGLRLVVMIHDTIPLDFPEFQRAGTAAAFAAKFAAAARFAHRIVCPSQAAAADVARHLAERGIVAEVVAAPLGVEPVAAGHLPQGTPEEPFFLALGTIEPRKNHALLLDVWERMGPGAPWLVICGARGWRNEAVFARLDRGVARVRELPGVDDAGVAALLDHARGLLFPSMAEGFGLPLAEAAARGTPVIASDLPVCREVAGLGTLYCDPRDAEAWERAVRQLCTGDAPRQPITPSGWKEHFNIALGVT
jgi:glycosyltransferase involved in cell wall biosynthesis